MIYHPLFCVYKLHLYCRFHIKNKGGRIYEKLEL